MTRRVMIYVQHLLGVGHLKRMSLLADSLSAAGADVLLVSGGMPVPHVHPSEAVQFHQLPPVKAMDQTFSALAGEDGSEVPEAFKARRSHDLHSRFNSFRPDVLVVELFPLGRRQMRFELLPLLEAARPVCGRIACSVRDIVNRRPKREAESIDWLNTYFDLLLVHGDRDLTPISDSVPGIAAFTGTIFHTGYLTKAWTGTAKRELEVLVSAGGGAAGEVLFRAAAEASRMTKDQLTWRIRHGRNASDALVTALKQLAHPSATIEPVADDFRERLARSAVSISQFGYNTAMDVLTTSTPSIVVPFEGGNETEQLRRAEAMAGHVSRIIREADLNAETMAAAALDCAKKPARIQRSVDTDGLQRSTSILLGG